MNINPMQLMKLKGELEGFNARHPKFRRFFTDVASKTDTGDVFEISLTKPDGTKMRTNIRIAKEDKDLFENLLGALGGKK